MSLYLPVDSLFCPLVMVGFTREEDSFLRNPRSDETSSPARTVLGSLPSSRALLSQISYFAALLTIITFRTGVLGVRCAL